MQKENKSGEFKMTHQVTAKWWSLVLMVVSVRTSVRKYVYKYNSKWVHAYKTN